MKATLSDPKLAADIRRYGKFDPTGCYQCGTCTISCELVSADATFPRLTMRYAMLGLREPLRRGLEPWLCQDCGDCSINCPRHAEPRISLMTVRKFLCGQYDWTGLTGLVIRSRAWHIALLVIVAVLTFGGFLGWHLLYSGMNFGEITTTAMPLEHMFPWMIYLTSAFIGLPAVLLLSFAVRMAWLSMRDRPAHVPVSAYFIELWTYLRETLLQRTFRRCAGDERWLGHGALSTGTLLMMTVLMFWLKWFQTDSIYPLYHPQRWLGYVGTVLMLGGATEIIIRHIQAKKEVWKTREFEDFLLPALLFLTALSGILVHVFRYAGLEMSCHLAFAAHVVIATPMLLIELPFGRWSHMVYRPLALYLLAVRRRAEARVESREVVPQYAA